MAKHFLFDLTKNGESAFAVHYSNRRGSVRLTPFSHHLQNSSLAPHVHSRRQAQRECASAVEWCSALGLLLLGCVLLPGCAGRDSMLLGGPTTGQLKTSLSHLQFENEQLKTELAKVKEEQRTVEDRLVQEQIHNGELASRLDNARNLLRDRGIDGDARLSARSRGSSPNDFDSENSRFRALPAGRPTRKPRKPPAANISGDLDALPTPSDDDDMDNPTISFRASDSFSKRRTFSDDWPASSIDDDHLRWQPVATSADPQSATRR
jgi:hypothetical protein